MSTLGIAEKLRTVATTQDVIDQTAGSHLLLNITTVDGAGSGLDSDLLDGHDSTYFAPVDSPSLTGTPTAPTATAGTSTTQLATTEFVTAAIASLNSLIYAGL
jgi:hypothetical protein